VKLIVQPEDGLTPLVKAIQKAKTSIAVVIFRFDRVDLEKALAAAVARGVAVRVLIAHTNGGGEKRLRKLEPRLLAAGVTVTRTADDLPRYHGKMTIVDDALFVLGFNYTRADIERSRSFGIVTRDAKLHKEALALFEADSTRQPYTPGHDRLVVSPDTSRERLSGLIGRTRKQLLIYDERISVEIRVIGKVSKTVPGVVTRSLPDLRMHVRAIISDGVTAFVGSQSLRKPELDERREIGVILKDARIAKRMADVFEADWALGKPGKNSDDADGARVSATTAAG
jgi:cardiolipin synthase